MKLDEYGDLMAEENLPLKWANRFVYLVVLCAVCIAAKIATRKWIVAMVEGPPNAAKAEIDLLKNAIDNFFLVNNRYPDSLNELEQASGTNNEAPFVEQPVPLDPWGRPYQYLRSGKHNPESYDLWSLGPNGVEDDDPVIGNW